jgi:hypothetical protein
MTSRLEGQYGFALIGKEWTPCRIILTGISERFVGLMPPQGIGEHLEFLYLRDIKDIRNIGPEAEMAFVLHKTIGIGG